jgi:MFS family permease
MIGLESPAIVQATVFGVGSSAIALGFGLGPLIGGIVASAAGIRAGLLVAAALAFILAVLVGFRAREPRGYPHPDPPPQAGEGDSLGPQAGEGDSLGPHGGREGGI